VIAQLIGHTVRGGMTSRYGDVPDTLVRDAADKVAAAIAAMLDAPPAQGQGDTRGLTRAVGRSGHLTAHVSEPRRMFLHEEAEHIRRG
jgi:hypothetical protein